MGLQTLKDIEMHVLTEANIKEAGIEWIQQLQSDHPFESKDALLGMDQYIKGQIDWIKMFFNITDEDLK